MSESEVAASERFELEAPLGQGAMGAVYRAYDRERHQRVALKRLLAPDATSIYRFKREFRALANVSHPNLVALYDLVASDDEWCFTMELVHGVDFLSYVRGENAARTPSQVSRTRELHPDARAATVAATDQATVELQSPSTTGPPGAVATLASPVVSNLARTMASAPASEARGTLDVDRLRSALSQLVQAIHVLHQTGHLHRDIKPSNVLVTDEGRVVVLDFGVITELSGSTRSGDDRIAGTPSYMAPELLDEVPPSAASDWYALGVVLYRALTGLVPFVGSSETILAAKRHHDIPLDDLLECGAPTELILLCKDLIQRDPAKRPGADEILRRLGISKVEVPASEPAAIHLVGRESELDALRSAWMDSRSGAGVGVFLHGVSGVGKSALVERFLEDLEESSDAVILTGRCYEQESVPYKAIDSLVDAMARHLLASSTSDVESILPDDVVALARAFPVLGRIDAVAGAIKGRAPGQDKAELQRRAFAALGELIDRLARTVPLVLYIDDLQWGDVDSAAFLARLLGEGGPPILFIAGYRSEHEESSPILPVLFGALAVESESRIRKIEVGPLSLPILESLAREMLDELEPHGRDHALRASHIASEAKGSPYFVHELVRYEVSAPGPERGAKATSLAAVIRARSEQLSAEGQRLLRVVCTAGGRISVGVAQRAAELGAEERRAFVELRAAHFVKSTGTGDDDTIEPYHDRVREMIGAALTSVESQAVHLHIAEALEAAAQMGNEQVYALANHWYLARPADRQEHIYEINLRAGRTAAASFAYFQANAYLGQAMEAAAAAGIAPDVDAHLLLADVQTRVGQAPDALKRYELVLAGSRDPLQRAETRWGISRIRLGWLETGEAIEQALAALDELGLRPPRNAVLAWLKAIFTMLVHAPGLRHLRQQGTAVGPDYERHRLGAALLIQLGLCYYYHLAPVKLLRTGMLASWIPSRLGFARETLEWHVMMGGAAAALRRGSLTDRIVARCREISTTIRDPVAAARTRFYRGVFHILLGDTASGERQLSTTMAEVGELLEPHDYYSAAASLAWPLMMRGRSAEGSAVIERTLRIETAGGQLEEGAGHSYRFYAAPLLARQGRIDEGYRHVEHPSDDTHGWRNAQLLAHTILYLVEVEDVGPSFDDFVRRYLSLDLEASRIPITLRHGFVAIAYGLLLQIETAVGGDRDVRIDQLREILKKVKTSARGIPLLVGHHALLEARYYNLVGKSDRARVLLDKAEEVAVASDNEWVLYEVAMERARFVSARGDRMSARKHLARAKAIADERGWPQCSRRSARMLAQVALSD